MNSVERIGIAATITVGGIYGGTLAAESTQKYRYCHHETIVPSDQVWCNQSNIEATNQSLKAQSLDLGGVALVVGTLVFLESAWKRRGEEPDHSQTPEKQV